MKDKPEKCMFTPAPNCVLLLSSLSWVIPGISYMNELGKRLFFFSRKRSGSLTGSMTILFLGSGKTGCQYTTDIEINVKRKGLL